MNTWYEVKSKYVKQQEYGFIKRVTESYLVDAVSFTDAEMRMLYHLEGVKGELIVHAIKRENIADVIDFEAETWYRCVVDQTIMDADSGKEKKTAFHYLVSSESVKEANNNLQDYLKDSMFEFEIKQIKLSPIVEVLPYDPNEEHKNETTINL